MRSLQSFIGIAVILALLAATMPAAAAGSSQSEATPIGEGTFTDTVLQWQAHWYVVDVPEGKAVRVSYQLISGDSWTRLYVVDASGSRVGSASSGSTFAYDPEGEAAWLLVDGFWGTSEYEFTVSFLDVPAQDDAGSGRDAGNRQATALAVAPGMIGGRLVQGVGDIADWYRVDAPAGLIVDVHSASTWVEVYRADGTQAGAITYYDSTWTPRAFSLVSTGDPVFFRVSQGDPYSFRVDLSKRADLRVESLEVRETELRTQATGTGTGIQREVVLAVTNVGEGDSRKAQLRVWTIHEDVTAERVLHFGSIQVPAGGEVVISIPWDTIGQVGDVTLVASVANEHDVDLEDNVQRHETYVLVGGLTRGVDLLNHDVRAANTGIRVEYGSERIGVATQIGFLGSNRGIVGLT